MELEGWIELVEWIDTPSGVSVIGGEVFLLDDTKFSFPLRMGMKNGKNLLIDYGSQRAIVNNILPLVTNGSVVFGSDYMGGWSRRG